MEPKIIHGDCELLLKNFKKDPKFEKIHCTFYDPPFNQGKDYAETRDDLPEAQYWNQMTNILKDICELTVEGGAMYFMQREKNTDFVLKALKDAGWTFQNLIVWKKLTSAVPGNFRFGKQYQIIAFCTKGDKPRLFNKLRIDPPLYIFQKYARTNGAFLTDIWDDIRELTSGYFAGDEPLKINDNERLHNQQSPVRLLLRIILSSSMPGDHIFDPFAGTGTTAIVAKQLNRKSTVIEIAEVNYNAIVKRNKKLRDADNIDQFCSEYVFTDNLDEIWGKEILPKSKLDYQPQYPVKKLEQLNKNIENLEKTRKELRKECVKEIKVDLDLFLKDYKKKGLIEFAELEKKLKTLYKMLEIEKENLNGSNGEVTPSGPLTSFLNQK